MLLYAVYIQHNNGAESVVLGEPKRAEDLRTLEDFVNDADRTHGGFKAGVDVFSSVDVRYMAWSSVNVSETGEVAEEKGAVNKEDCVEVGEIEDVALALIQWNEKRGVKAFCV
jgi:hypothetical protein